MLQDNQEHSKKTSPNFASDEDPAPELLSNGQQRISLTSTIILKKISGRIFTHTYVQV